LAAPPPVAHNHSIQLPAPTRAFKTAPTLEATDARLNRIVRLLTDNATVVVSGTKIAAELGASRSEVWRLIRQLRENGVAIAGHPSIGYQLEAMPDLLLPDILAPLLKGTMFTGQVHHYFRAGSTNALALEAGAAGMAEGAVFLAEEQTAGRGRGGHSWHSARGDGIYCSVLLRPALPPTQVLLLSLAAGLAVRSAVLEVAGLAADLKWPNDLLLGAKKFCGILTEMHSEATRVRHVVVGMGLNVNQRSFPEDLRGQATSLFLESRTVCSRVELAGALLKSLDREYRALVAEPEARESILHRFQEHSSWTNGCAVRIEDDEESFTGITEGLDAQGFLQVRTPHGLRTVVSGTVRRSKP
jgi:BirA family biotin operon repressor/biotin-[acetyl-CoA-carboxylase] ligase